MRKLEITQSFENIQKIYNTPSIKWTESCAEFSVNNDDNEGQLTVWQDGVAPEQIFTEAIPYLENKINQFLQAMQVTDNPRIQRKGHAVTNYTGNDGNPFDISNTLPINIKRIVNIILKRERGEGYSDIQGIIEFKCFISSEITPISFPSTLPQAPLEFQRLIEIFSSAENFSGVYKVEHQLRNYFLIMEELCDTKYGMNISKPDFYNDLHHIRNFISHAGCDYDSTKNFIKRTFPNAISINGTGGEYAQFDRTQESHINFISIYRDNAYRWVEKKLANFLNS